MSPEPEILLVPAPPGGFPLLVYLVACPKCGRRLVMELLMHGTGHHLFRHVTCVECLEVPDDFRQANPEIAARVEAFGRSV